MATSVDPDFPCSLTIDVPFPSSRLADAALQALGVDKELSPSVRRNLTIASPSPTSDDATADLHDTVLRTIYKATTNRMLRVAVNSFMESLNLVIEVMEQLDEDVVLADAP